MDDPDVVPGPDGGIELDLDGDGIADSVVRLEDGVLAVESDTTGDGQVDTAWVATQGDGVFDQVHVDLDGDLVTDVIHHDLDGDGTFEVVEDLTSSGGGFGTPVDASVIGALELEWFEAQSGPGLCVPTCVAMIVSESGMPIDHLTVSATAAELGLLSSGPEGWEGMTADGARDLLEHYGVAVEVEQGDLDDLRRHLADGRDILLAVDSEELWYGGEGGAFADHAVLVTAIDDHAGVAYLNDPGLSWGGGLEVPLDVLESAWADSDHTMVVTSTGDDEAGAGMGPFAGLAAAGTVLLPIRLVARAARRG